MSLFSFPLSPSAADCPPEIIDSLVRYRDHGIPTGSFLEAVLCNDLQESVARADSQNLFALHHIVVWIYHNMPRNTYGNKEILHAHFIAKKIARESSSKVESDSKA